MRYVVTLSLIMLELKSSIDLNKMNESDFFCKLLWDLFCFPERRSKESLMVLLQKLMPKILELACDVEPVTKQLFEPLIVEIIHHFSRHAQKTPVEAGVILDRLMDGLVTERNPTIRSFCARCVSEFLEWSAKGVKVNYFTTNHVSLASLIRSLFFFLESQRRTCCFDFPI